MELEIVSKKENLLLDRVELEVRLTHQGEPTPQRDVVREQVAAALKAKKDRVVVDHLDTTFGVGLTRGYVKVYSTSQAALAIEEKPILGRNQLIVEGKEKAVKKVAPAAAKPKAEPKTKPKEEAGAGDEARGETGDEAGNEAEAEE